MGVAIGIVQSMGCPVNRAELSSGVIAKALRSRMGHVRKSFATSSLAYLLREKVWSGSAWTTKAPVRARKRKPLAAGTGREVGRSFA